MLQVIRPADKDPEAIRRSIFLAGPTPRGETGSDQAWRDEAIKILRDIGYSGSVFSPEPFPKNKGYEYQVEWEDKHLNMADAIVFWVPRTMDMPGFTTNIEYGEWMKSGRVIFGAPPEAWKTRYLLNKADTYKIPHHEDLKDTLKAAKEFIGEGSLRKGGERSVPYFIWKTPSFQQWYAALKKAGNRLEDSRVEWSYRVGPNKDIVFCWALWVDVYITKEKRHKTNEFVFSRTDISVIVAFKPADDIDETQVLMIKEFRSPVSNNEGFVHELPGGSSKDTKEDPRSVAAHELEEETSLKVSKNRFKVGQTRQMTATLSAHRAHVYLVELTDQEIQTIRKNKGKTHGVAKDSEMTYTEIRTLKELMEDQSVDWSMLGILLHAITGRESCNDDGDFVGAFMK